MPKSETFCMDCMDALRAMPDKAFDLAVVDPPYGIGIDGQRENINIRKPKQSRKLHPKMGWDDARPDAGYFAQLYRVSKNQIIWGGNYFVENINEGHKGWIVWDKLQYGLTMSDCEIAYTSFDTPTRIWKMNRFILREEGTIHPTQKPIALYKWIFSNYAKPGDLILDTHMGSGSSRIAAYDMGLDFVGYEINKTYYDLEEKRFAEHAAQIQLDISPDLYYTRRQNMLEGHNAEK